MVIRWSLRIALGVVVATSIGLGFSAPASAGGSWFEPVKDRYEPGEKVKLVGYTGGGAYGWIDDGPFFGFLMDSTEDGGMDIDGRRVALGELALEETGRSGYLSLRASITFSLPEDLEPGVYWFDYCNEGCGERLGDLIGGVVHVGIDPDYPIAREWPLDDPEVANLDESALLSGPGFEVTAGEIQEGSIEVGEDGLVKEGSLSPITSPSSPTTSTPSVREALDAEADDETTPDRAATVAVTDIDERSGRWRFNGLVATAGLGVIAGGAALLRRRGRGKRRSDGPIVKPQARQNEPDKIAP